MGLNLLGHLHCRMTAIKLKPSFKSISMKVMLKWNGWAIILFTTNRFDSLSFETLLLKWWRLLPLFFKYGKEWKRVSLGPKKKIWEIVLVLSLEEFYAYRLVKVKVTNIWVTKLIEIVKQSTQACSCIVLMFYATLGCPSWFLPLVRQKAFEGFLFLLVIYFFGNPAWFFLTSVTNVFYY